MGVRFVQSRKQRKPKVKAALDMLRGRSAKKPWRMCKGGLVFGIWLSFGL
jgi:hypothetical protein